MSLDFRFAFRMNTARPVGLVMLCLAGFVLFSPKAHSRYEKSKEIGISSSERPKEFEGVGITEKLGSSIKLDVPVIDEQGETKSFSSYFRADKPTLFSLVYLECTGLCNLHLTGVLDGLKEQRWRPGKDFDYIVLSFDPRDKSSKASDAKKNYLKQYGFDDPATAAGVHFLTAPEESIKKITEQAGFQYKWLEKEKEWAHASAAIFVTPAGVMGRYMHGVVFEPKTLEFAFGEVAQGRLGNIVDQLIWYCFKYDQHQSKYTVYAFRIMQLGAIFMVLLLGLILIPFWLRSRNQAA